MQEKFNDFKINFLKKGTRSEKQRGCQGTIMSCGGRGKWRGEGKGGLCQAKLGLFNQLYQGSISVSTPAKSQRKQEVKDSGQ